jgi:hypothetical protein
MICGVLDEQWKSPNTCGLRKVIVDLSVDTAARFSAAQIWKTGEKQDIVKRARRPMMITSTAKAKKQWIRGEGHRI